ncbi:MAG: LysE family translocator [Lautropia sp.]
MTEFTAWSGIVAALLIGVVSPGPSFLMVARTAVASSRRAGLAAAAGMGLGGVAFGGLALLGLQAVLAAVPALYAALKVLGGLYLGYLGWRIFASATRALDAVEPSPGQRSPAGRAFLLGLATQVSNPKTAIVYASVFAAFLPAHFSSAFVGTLLGTLFVVEAGWYAIVAVALSSAAPRAIYLSCKSWADRAAGVVMLGLGIRLILSAREH